MRFLFFAIAWAVGIVVGAFTLGQMLIILRFAIPTSIRWYRLGWFTAVRPLSRYVASLLILAAIFAITIWTAIRFFPSYRTGFFIGVGISFLLALGKSGANNDNVADFVQTNLAYIDQAQLEGVVEKLGVADKLKGITPNHS